MIHDVIPLLFPNKFPSEILKEWNGKYKHIAHQADGIVTVSQSSAKDISERLGITLDKIRVIYNDVTRLPVNENSAVSLPKDSYLVYVGAYDYHKNVDVVLKSLTFPQVSHIHLIMVGNNRMYEKMVRKLGLHDRVHFLGSLANSDLGYVIQNALALVLPSYYEGFGLPPMEAALLGVPSICSNRPAMNELLKDAALFCEPDDPEAWVQAIYNIDKNDCLKKTIILNSNKRASEYGRGRSAINLLRYFSEILQS